MKQSLLRPSGIGVGFAACCAAMLVSTAATAQRGAPDRGYLVPVQYAAPSGAAGQGPTNTEPIVARLSLRISQLEDEIRRLTGQNEELAHQVRQLSARLDKLSSDQELRLRALEAGGKPPTGPAEGASERTGASQAPPVRAPSMAAVPGADKGAKVLGTIRRPGASGVAPAQPPAEAKETPEQLYDRAYALLAKDRDYAGAERVLKTFIKENPNHALAANAHYWLGRTYFVRGDFENAAFAFAEGFQKFPKSDKAPANLLNLGMSLSRLGKNREACTTYARLLRTYKSVDDSIKRRVARERERAKCRQR